MIKAVYDTNVIVSALLTSEGTESLLLDIATQGKITLYVSEDILREYEGVLSRPKFSFSKRLVKRFIRLLKRKSNVVKTKPLGFDLKDPDDNKFLECAVAAKADYLVTGNARHFPVTAYESVQIVSPAKFWDVYKQNLL